MNIMHVITSLERGGAQAVVYDLVVQFQKQGYTQSIVYMHDGPYRERFEILHIPMHSITGIISPFDPIALYQLTQLMRMQRPDYVHTILWAANWLGRCAARILGISCVVSLHNNYDQNGAVRRMLDRLMPYHAHAIIAVSDEVKQSFNSVYPNIPVVVIPNGIDVQSVQQSARQQKKTRAQLALADTDFVIGSVGRFHLIKQYPLLLEAFARVHTQYPHARLVLIGQGDQEQQLRSYAQQLGIAESVRWIIGQQAYGYYNLFDCFVLTSWKEGISIALLEAMSLGVVPVTTYHSVQHPVIKSGVNGCVANTDKATVFAAKIADCIASRELCKRMASSAQHTVQNSFAVQHMIAAYNRIFRMIQI